MTWPLVKFVDGPWTTATVRMDLAREKVKVLSESFTLGHPKFDGAPLSVGVDYGYRNPSMTVRVKGDETTALAELQKLAREIMRPDNWLLFQWSPLVQPMWLRLFRGEPGDLSLTNAAVDIWDIVLPLTAEGFAYGALVATSTATITNDPAAGTNRARWVVPDTIKGDAPAAATLVVIPSVTWGYSTILFSTCSFNTPAAPSLHVWQTSGFSTAGADTTLSTPDATFSGGTKSVVTFATQAGMVGRVQGQASTSPEPGRYRVLARVARSDTASKFAVELRLLYGTLELPGNGTIANLDRGASAAAGYACLLDLGEFTFPLGGEGWSVAEAGAYPSPGLSLRAQRLSGAGSLWFDYLVAIPVNTATTSEARMMRSYFKDSSLDSLRHGIWDATKQLYRSMNFGIAMTGFLPAQLAGRFPVLEPGKPNVVHLHHQVGCETSDLAAANSDSITATADVHFEYHPRYLNLPGGL